MREFLYKYRVDMIVLIIAAIATLLLEEKGIFIATACLGIYLYVAGKLRTSQIVIFAICCLGAILAIYGLFKAEFMENKGLDYIGEAIVYGFMILVGRGILIVGPLILNLLGIKRKERK